MTMTDTTILPPASTSSPSGSHTRFVPVLGEQFAQRLPKSIAKKLDRFDLDLLGTVVRNFVDEIMMEYDRDIEEYKTQTTLHANAIAALQNTILSTTAKEEVVPLSLSEKIVNKILLRIEKEYSV